jgi:pyruvate dehydrogenase E2 component (dihydrolipoamide acetyltransferase)
MAHLLLMPAISANSTHAMVQEWSKAEGDSVAAGDVLAEIETDKAVIELTAEHDGVMGRTFVDLGVSVEVGAPIAVVLATGDGPEAADALLPGATPTPQPGPPRRGPSSNGVDPAQPAPPMNVATHGTDDRQSVVPANHRFSLSPIARKLARELGVDITTLRGSGPGGRIIRSDIERAATNGHHQPAERSAAPTPAAVLPPTVSVPLPPATQSLPAPPETLSTGSSFTETPHSGMRRTIARRLTESTTTVPHFYVTTDCKVDDLLELRQRINRGSNRKISVNDLVVLAMVAALREVPEANVSWTDTGLRRYDHVDIAVAVSTPGGLITPIIRSADMKKLSNISAEITLLAERARAGRLQPHEYQGGSFTVSNLGMHGVSEFAAIINPPHAGILAVGAARPTPVVADGTLTVATVMRCTMSADHRSLDGELAARLLSTFTRLIENPLPILV